MINFLLMVTGSAGYVAAFYLHNVNKEIAKNATQMAWAEHIKHLSACRKCRNKVREMIDSFDCQP